MKYSLLLAPLALLASCSFEPRLDSEFVLHAEALSIDRTCQSDNDCSLINQDCCNSAEGFLSVSQKAKFRLQKSLAFDCKEKRSKNASLCTDKTAVDRHKMPLAVCVEGQCSTKDKSTVNENDKAKCENDAQCGIFDPDCCDSGDNPIAINHRFDGSERHKKSVECKDKRKANPDMCRGKRELRFKKPLRARCIEAQCKIQGV